MIPKQKKSEVPHASEARLQQVIATPTVGVLFFGLSGGIHSANATFERMSGYSSDQLRHIAHWKTLTAPEFWGATEQEAQQLAAAGKAPPYEKQMVRRDGSRWWGLFAPARLSGSGWETECIEFIIDITERKRAEDALRESERVQRLLAETGELASRVSNVEVLLEAVGERVARKLGVSRCGFSEVDLDAGTVTVLKDYHGDLTSIAGTFPVDRFMEHWLEEGRDGLPTVMADLATHPRTAELYEAAFRPIQVRAHLTVPLHRGSKWVANFWASHHESHLWSPNDVEMMQLVAERVWSHVERSRAEEALRVANERLVEADHHKNEFLAVLSHELRNPLTPIRNSVYVLERAAPGGEQAERARQVIDRQTQHMTRLIEDLLDVTRISRGKITLQRERLDLRALARGTAEDLSQTFAGNGVELEIDVAAEPLWVDGDRTRLAQVIGNLLGNAAKFTPRGGATTLTVSPSPEGHALLRVTDTGVGMTEETVREAFEPFAQAAQTLARSSGGLGLGLALVQGLARMHGGHATATSAGLGKGSEFTVTLPLLQVSAGPRSPSVPSPPGAHPRSVLVIEDNPDAAQSLREALELGEHEVAISHSGSDGIEQARKLKPAIILCDLGLPGVDGYGVARALRADPDAAIRTTFLVALSGYALPEDVAKSKEAGFDRHLSKPPDLGVLEKLLHEAAAHASAGTR